MAETLWNVFCRTLLSALLLSTPTYAAMESPQTFTYQGRMMDASGTTPLTGTTYVTLTVMNPAANCILYEEIQSSVDLGSTGLFALDVGSATGAAKRTANDPGLSMATVFANAGVQIRAPGTNCTGGYTPANGDVRVLRVNVGGVTLTPNLTMTSVPNATVAETLQGLGPAQFIRVNATVTQGALDTLTNAGDASALHHHDTHNDGRYVRQNYGSSQNLGSGNLYTSGKIGVGTTSPAATTNIDVKADDPVLRLTTNTTGVPKLEFYSDAGTTVRTSIEGSGSTNSLTFKTGGTQALQLDANQNAIFNGSVSVSGTLGLGKYTTTDETTPGTGLIPILTGLGVVAKGITWMNSTTNTIRYWDGSAAQTVATSANSPWSVSGNDISNSNSGNVGIGTSTPISQLHVAATSNAGVGISIDAKGSQNLQHAGLNLITKGDGATPLDNANTKGWVLSARGDAYTTAAHQNDFGIWQGDGTTWNARFWIDSVTGNLGVGTSAPSYPLSVSNSAYQLGLESDSGADGNIVLRHQVGELQIKSNTQTKFRMMMGTANFQLVDNNAALFFGGFDGDTGLYREGANALGLRYNTGAQNSMLRPYGSFTSTTDFERLNLGYNSGNGEFVLQTEKGSGGGAVRPLTLGVDGGRQLTIDTDGEVGVGINSASDKLHLVGQMRIDNNTDGTNKGCLRFNGSTNKLEFSHDCSTFSEMGTGGGGFGGGPLNEVTDINNTSGGFTLTPSTGNSVTINQNTASTSTSSGALVVNGGVGVAGAINSGGAITATGAGATNMLNIISGNANTAGDVNGAASFTIGDYNFPGTGATISVQSNDPQGADKGGSIGFMGRYTGTARAKFSMIKGAKENSTDLDLAGYLAFGTRPSAGSVTERMRITSTGNVGIGTTTPGNKLEVAGLIRFDDTTQSTFYGNNAGAVNAGSWNTFVGYQTGDANTTGIRNTAVGWNAFGANVDGTANAAFGGASLGANTNGGDNAAFGYRSLELNSSGSGNAALGRGALNQSSGDNNIGVGAYSADNLTAGSGNIFIGAGIDAQNATGSNQLSIGNLIFGTGVDGTGTTVSTGNVGIGVTNPAAKLDVNGTIKISGGTPGNGKVLTSDANGLASWTAAPAGAVSGLVDAASSTTLNNANFAQLWKWDTLTTETAMTMSSTSATTGSVVKIESDNNSASSTGNALKIGVGGTSNAATGIMLTNSGTGNSLRINDDGTDTDSTPFVVDAAGRVGIGTATPDTTKLLNIIGDGTGGIVKFERQNSNTNIERGILQLLATSTGTMADGHGGGIYMSIDGNGVSQAQVARMSWIRDGANNSGKLEFATSDGGTETVKMTIKPNGNIGVGTATPQLLNGTDYTSTSRIFQVYSSTLPSVIGVSGVGAAGISLVDSNAGANIKTFGYVSTNGKLQSYIANDSGSSTILTTQDQFGRLGVGGITSPDAWLKIPAGTTNAGSAPIKLTAGTNMTTPEAGAIEYDGTGFFITDGSATRRQIHTVQQANSSYLVKVGDNMTGTLGVVNGTAAAPGIHTVGADQNSGLFFGTDIIGFSTDGSERLRIDSTGKVGIGTTAPVTGLEITIAGASGAPATSGSTQSAGHRMRLGGSGNSILDIGSDGTNGAWLQSTHMGSLAINYPLLINPNGGNVGIGTTSPSAALQLKAGTAASNTAPLKFTAGTNLTTPEAGAIEFDGPFLYYTDNTNTRQLLLSNAQGISSFLIKSGDNMTGGLGIINGTVSSPGLKFTGASGDTGLWSPSTDVLAVSTAGAERLRVDASGNVGIGTSSPKSKLHVNDEITVAVNNALMFNGYNDGADKFAATDSAFEIWHDGAGDKLVIGSSASGTVDTGVTFTNAIIVDTAGKVGIQNNSPAATLDVNGYMKLAKNASAPATCDAGQDGAIALTSQYTMCVCKNGTGWVRTTDGSTACTW